MSEIQCKHYRCRHILTDGRRCGGKSLRGEELCYFHHTNRRPAYHRHGEILPNRKSTFDLPLFEDRTSVQASIYEVANRLAHNQIDSRRAALLLYAMQIALQTHPRLVAAAPDPNPEMVEEVTLHPTLGRLAPASEFGPPKREKSRHELLMEQWEREP